MLGSASRRPGSPAAAQSSAHVRRLQSHRVDAHHLIRGSVVRTGGTAAATTASIPAWWRRRPTDCRRRCSLRMKASTTPKKKISTPNAGDVGADRRDQVPAGEGIRIVDDAARHAGEAEEVLREEHEVDADEGHPEVQLADASRCTCSRSSSGTSSTSRRRSRTPRRATARSGSAPPRNRCPAATRSTPALASTTPVTPPTVNRKMKPIAHSIGVLELDRAAPHGGDPGEDLHAGRHRDHHGGGDEIGLRAGRHADRVHVVRPHDEADAADRDHGVGHAEIAEHRLAARRSRRSG